jgi:hypothetical protein
MVRRCCARCPGGSRLDPSAGFHGPATAGAESLADAARREKARREKVQAATGKATAVVTETELAASKGELATVLSGPAGRPAARASGGAPPRTPAAGGSGSDDREEYWRSRMGEARARLAAAEARYETLDRAIRLGQPGIYDSNGRRRAYSLQSLKAMADEAQAEVEEARRAMARLEDDARRAGALPGWLR